MCSSFLPKVSGPSLSDIPHSQTILRAISVAFSRSSPAPVVCWFSTTSSAARPPLQLDVGRQRDAARVHAQDLLAALDVRARHDHLAIEAARPEQCGIEDVGTVGGGDEDHALVGLEAVHLDEELVQRLLALVVATAEPGPAMPPHRVDLIHEDDAGRVLLALLKKVAHARR